MSMNVFDLTSCFFGSSSIGLLFLFSARALEDFVGFGAFGKSIAKEETNSISEGDRTAQELKQNSQLTGAYFARRGSMYNELTEVGVRVYP